MEGGATNLRPGWKKWCSMTVLTVHNPQGHLRWNEPGVCIIVGNTKWCVQLTIIASVWRRVRVLEVVQQVFLICITQFFRIILRPVLQTQPSIMISDHVECFFIFLSTRDFYLSPNLEYKVPGMITFKKLPISEPLCVLNFLCQIESCYVNALDTSKREMRMLKFSVCYGTLVS